MDTKHTGNGSNFKKLVLHPAGRMVLKLTTKCGDLIKNYILLEMPLRIR